MRGSFLFFHGPVLFVVKDVIPLSFAMDMYFFLDPAAAAHLACCELMMLLIISRGGKNLSFLKIELRDPFWLTACGSDDVELKEDFL